MRNLGWMLVVAVFLGSCLKTNDGYEREMKLLRQYLADNNITVEPTATGLYYLETEIGSGPSVEADDFLVIRYTGRLLTGLIFTSTDSAVAAQNNFYNPDILYGPFKFEFQRVSMVGIREGLSYMKEGGKATLIIPSNLAYGSATVGVIPSFSTLIYEIELLAVIKDPEAHETDLLNQYISDNGITVLPTTSGLYYIELEEGTGLAPLTGQTCVTTFTGSLLDGRIFAKITESNPYSFSLGVTPVIEGFEEGVSYMKPGGKAMFIIPFNIGYGENGSSDGIIPPYSTIIYEVELKEVN
jgi:FKBP-type peptidyl-prolyl cis-trans isomerase FkpA